MIARSSILKINVRRIFLFSIIILIGTVGAVRIGDYLSHKTPYNLVLISVDTLRSDHMGVYGYEKNTTPNIDEWAKKSAVFTNAYTVFPLTFQSFYTLFTGTDDVLRNANLSYSGSVLSYEDSPPITLAEILQRNQYKTAAFVSNPVIDPLGAGVFSRGFDEFNKVDNSGLSQDINLNNASELFGQIFRQDYENSIKLTNDSIGWLNKNKDESFFLWLHYSTPHEPYNPPKNLACSFESDVCQDNYYENLTAERLERCVDSPPSKSERVIKGLKSLYDTEIISTDEQIGKVLKVIEEQKLNKNTIVIFYSDHGESFERNIFSHGYSLYNSDVRIPLIIKLPGLTKGQKLDGLIDNTDILPTILDLISIKYSKADFSGISFKNIFRSRTKNNNKEEIFFNTPIDFTNKYGLIIGKYKYIYSPKNICIDGENNEELYDLEQDPKENHNLINIKLEIAKDFKSKLESKIKMRETNSTGNLNNGIDLNELRQLGY